MASPIRSLPRSPTIPDPSPPTFIEQLQDTLAFALLDLSNLETQIYNGRGGGLRLRRDLAEQRVNGLRAQLAEELARAEVAR